MVAGYLILAAIVIGFIFFTTWMTMVAMKTKKRKREHLRKIFK